jgi:RND family efflux transporter MFP subunit
MKRIAYLLLATIILASCGGEKKNDTAAKLDKLKKDREKIDEQIRKLEASIPDTSRKPVPVSVLEVKPADFQAYINVQSEVVGDENVYANPQAAGTVISVNVHVGQQVSKGQVLAVLDAAAVEQQIKAQDAQVVLYKSIYEKQQKLWQQNIGTEIQLLTAKAQYESAQKQKGALIAQRDMYKVVAPISGIVDQMNLKVGDMAGPLGGAIRIVSSDKLKAEANLGETYLGKVHTGDKVILVLPDINDSIVTKLSYVSQAVDPASRAFLAQVQLGNNPKLHPNMSCIMKIANYEHGNAITVPVSVIQKTSKGDMVYIASGNVAKSVYVTTGHSSNGMVEITSGLNAGDKVIVAGFENVDNGQPISIQ